MKRWTVAACASLLLAGCAANTAEERQPDTAGQPEPNTTGQLETNPGVEPPHADSLLETPETRDAGWSISPRPSHEGEVGEADLEVIERFVAFAVDPTVANARRVPFAQDGVRLGLGEELTLEVHLADIASPRSWEIDQEHFRAYNGPFRPLSSIRTHVKSPNTPGSERRGSGLQVSVGEYPHCVEPPVPAPGPLESSRRISVQPADGSFSSCITWFSVDLYVNSDDVIEALTFDLYAP